MGDNWLDLYKKIRGLEFKKAILPIVVFFVLLAAMYLVWVRVLDSVIYERKVSFDIEANRVTNEIIDRMNVGDSILNGIKGYYESMSRTITPEEWIAYTKNLEASLKDSCIDELGYIKKTDKNTLASTISDAEKYSALELGRPYNIADSLQPGKSEYNIIKYLAPLDANSAALEGFDYSSDPALLKALHQAAETNMPVGTPILKMIGNNDARIDTISPIYDNSSSPSAETINGQIRGYVLAITDINLCGQDILNGPIASSIDYEVYDITDNPSAAPFFDTNTNNQIVPQFIHQSNFDFRGRHWLIVFKALPQFGAQPSDIFYFILYPITAVLLSFLISLLIFVLSTSRARALRLADRMTGLLQDSEAKLKAIFEQAPDAIFVLDDSGHFIDANPAGVAMHGISKAELLSNHVIFDFIYPDEKTINKNLWAKFLKEGEIRHDFKFKDPKSGKEKYMEIFARAHYLPGLNLAVIRDVTSNRETEISLRKAEQLWKTVFSAANDAILVLDDKFNIINCNESAERNYGGPKEEIIGRNIFDVRSKRGASMVGENIENEVRTRGSIFETEHTRRDGTLIPVEVSIKPFELFGQKYFVDIVRDISERKKSADRERRVNRALRVLSESNMAMVRTNNETELLNSICRIITDIGGYKLSWIGSAVNDKEKSIKYLAQSGSESGYLEGIKISWGDNEYGRGPTGTAIRTQKTSVMSSISDDPSYSVWRDAALKRGYQSSISIPVVFGPGDSGALNIYASEPEAFDAEEVRLLNELAADLGFGVANIRLRKELEASEEKFSKAFYMSSVLTAITVPENGMIIDVNDSYCKLLEYKREEVIGHTTLELNIWVDPEQRDQVVENIKKVGRVTDKEVNLRTKTGKVLTVMISFTPVIIGGENRFLSVAVDITDRRSLENKLLESNADLEKFKLAVQNASDHIIITDPDAKILYANQAASKITGYPTEEMIGKTPRLWGGQMSNDFYKKMWNTIKNEKLSFSGEVTNRRKSGELYQAVMSISPILDEKDNIIFFVGIERDVTKERAVDKAKTEFVSLASHQLRTPLSAINWYTEMLLDEDVGKINKKQKDYLGEIYHSSKRMADLVGSLLNVSRIELGTFAIEPKLTDLVEISKSVIKELALQIKKKNQKISEKYDKDMGTINVDQSLMRIVLQNLISNSVKYTAKKGKIEVEIHKIGNNVIVSVADNGYGIPAYQQSRIFEKFFRADNIREVETDGTGLGLYIIREIIEKSGGSIWFQSKENEGTKFFVSIPITGMTKKEGPKKLV